MKRTKSGQLIPPFQSEIMKILWDHGPSNVREVRSRLCGEPAYTTVQTTLNRMAKQGRTKRYVQGKSYTYDAALLRDEVVGAALQDFIDRMFDGSAENLLLNLLKTGKLSEGTFEKLRKADSE